MRSQDHSRQEPPWLVVENAPVLEGTRLALVRVAHYELSLTRRGADCCPLATCREAGAASTFQTALIDRCDQVLGRQTEHRTDRIEGIVIAEEHALLAGRGGCGCSRRRKLRGLAPRRSPRSLGREHRYRLVAEPQAVRFLGAAQRLSNCGRPLHEAGGPRADSRRYRTRLEAKTGVRGDGAVQLGGRETGDGGAGDYIVRRYVSVSFLPGM